MNISLRTKIAIFVTLIIIILSAISTYIFISQHRRSIEKEFTSRGLTLSYLLSKIAAEGLAAERLDLIGRASFILNSEDVMRVDVYTELWDLIESYPSPSSHRSPSLSLTDAIKYFSGSDNTSYINKDGKDRHFFYKVTFQPYEGAVPITIGYVMVDLSTSGMEKAIDNMIKTNILISWITTVIAVLILNILIGRIIGKPIMDIHSSVRKFQEGTVPEIKTSHSPDEIGDLAREFNEMSRAVKEKENLLIESERNITSLFERVEHAIFRLDKDGNIIKTNRKFNELFGEKIERLCDIFIGEKRIRDYFENMDFANRVKIEEKVIGKNGEELIVLLSLYPDMDYREDTKHLIGFDGYMLNITERKKAEENIRLSARVMESAMEGVFITDRGLNIQKVNPAFTDITGFTINDVIGRNADVLSVGLDNPEYPRCQIWADVKKNNLYQGEVWNRRKNGEVYPAWLSISSIKDETGEAAYYVGIFTDITQRKLFEDHLKKIAHYDILTGLPNRALFNELLIHAVEQAKRDQKKLAVMFLDLDNFKAVNDAYGHAIGDMLLQEVAQRLKECIRQSDTVSRLSGDEFAVILNQIGEISNAVFIAQKIILDNSHPFYPGGNEIKTGVSIGISLYPEDSSDAETLLENADSAMYLAKNSGKNNYRFFSERTDSSLDMIK